MFKKKKNSYNITKVNYKGGYQHGSNIHAITIQTNQYVWEMMKILKQHELYGFHFQAKIGSKKTIVVLTHADKEMLLQAKKYLNHFHDHDNIIFLLRIKEKKKRNYVKIFIKSFIALLVLSGVTYASILYFINHTASSTIDIKINKEKKLVIQKIEIDIEKLKILQEAFKEEPYVKDMKKMMKITTDVISSVVPQSEKEKYSSEEAVKNFKGRSGIAFVLKESNNTKSFEEDVKSLKKYANDFIKDNNFSTYMNSMAEKNSSIAVDTYATLISAESVKKSDKARLLTEQSNLLEEMNYKELAKKGYKKAQKLYEELSKKDFNGVAPSLAWTKNRLLKLKSQIDKEALVDIEKLYLSKIRNLRRLVKRNPKKYKSTLAWTLNLLANFYEEQYQGLPKSLKTRTEAYRIYKKIFTKEDRKIGIDYFQTMNSLAYSYLVQKERKSAKNFYEKAFELIKEMSEKEPKYLPYYALSLNQLALLHQDEHQFKRAKEYYLRSLEVYKKLLPKKPEKYTLLSLNVQKNMAQFHLLQGEFLEAEKKYFFILKEYNKMKKAHPSKYQLKIAELYNTIARIYLLNPKKRQYAKAESYLLKALKTDKNKKDKFQKKRNNVVATTQFYLALLYDTQRKFEKADSYYLKSFEAKRSLKREEIYAQSLGKREEFIKTRAFYEEMLKRYPRKEQQAEIWRNYGMFYRAVSDEGAKRRLMNSLKLYQALAKQYQIAYDEIKEIESLIHQMDATLATKTLKVKPS